MNESPNNSGEQSFVGDLLRRVHRKRRYSEEEVMQLAQEHAWDANALSPEEIFDYWEGKLDQSARASVEARAAAGPFAFHLFTSIGGMVAAPATEGFLVRLQRKMGEHIEELGRLVFDAAKAAVEMVGAQAPQLTLNAGPAMLEDAAKPSFTLRLTLRPSATGAGSPDLKLLLNIQVQNGEVFNLKATALAPRDKSVEGIKMLVESPALDQPRRLVSNQRGTFVSADGGGTVMQKDLPFTAYLFRVQSEGEEFTVQVPDLKRMLRQGTRAETAP